MPISNSPDQTSPFEVRQRIYPDGLLTQAEMELVFEGIRKAGSKPSPEWTDLFCESLTDYVVHQNEPKDYISDAKAEWLMNQLRQPGGVSSKAEFAMLVELMDRALGVPPPLSAFGLTQIATAITSGRRTAFTDEDHPARIIAQPDCDALRAVLYAATSGSACHVTLQEAEVLFDISDAAAKGKVIPAFEDLFARAIGNYLMAISLRSLGAGEVLHREKWLDERESMTGFFSRILGNASGISYREMLKTPLEAAEDNMKTLVDEDDRARAVAEKITEEEEDWVVGKLLRDGELSPAEKRLLRWLADEAPALPPRLKTLADKATPAQTPAFGRRQAI